MSDSLATASSGPVPELSIVIPAFNRAAAIGETLRSIGPVDRSAVEVIVIDDGSSDGTADVARAVLDELGMGGSGRVETQTNGGPGAARNVGLRLARGRFVAFLDSDDAWFPWTLPILREALAAHPDVALAFLRVRNRPATGALPAETRSPAAAVRHPGFLAAYAASDHRHARFGTNNAVALREAALRVGGFEEGIRCREDTDLFLRLEDAGPCLMIDAPALVAYTSAGDDRLSNKFDRVKAGFDFMLAREAAGGYPGGAEAATRRQGLLAAAARVTAEIAFSQGHVGAAYRLIAGNALRILRFGRPRWLARLALTPLLSLVRPDAHRFRLRPMV